MHTGETSGGGVKNRLFANENVMTKALLQYWLLIKHQTNTQFLHFKTLERIRLAISDDVFPWLQFLKSRGKHRNNPSTEVCKKASQMTQKGRLKFYNE